MFDTLATSTTLEGSVRLPAIHGGYFGSGACVDDTGSNNCITLETSPSGCPFEPDECPQVKVLQVLCAWSQFLTFILCFCRRSYFLKLLLFRDSLGHSGWKWNHWPQPPTVICSVQEGLDFKWIINPSQRYVIKLFKNIHFLIILVYSYIF